MKYECNECDMSVEGMKCGQCGAELVHENSDKGGKKTGVAKCPKGCGKIKSPQCCGEDMTPKS